jgi:hypothetical protein
VTFRVRLYLNDGSELRDLETTEQVWRRGDLITIGADEQYRVLTVIGRDTYAVAPLDEVSPYLALLCVEPVETGDGLHREDRGP